MYVCMYVCMYVKFGHNIKNNDEGRKLSGDTAD